MENKIKLSPIGVLSRRYHSGWRYVDLAQAIRRYQKAGIVPPEDWIEELNELRDYFTKKFGELPVVPNEE